MNDDFLHRLRKDPPPEFAARLQARLRLQPALPRLRGPSLLRNFVTVLLLGGTAFAITSFSISGLPESLLKLYQHFAAPITVGSRAAPADRARRYEPRAMRPWSPDDLRSPANSTAPEGSAHPAAPATSPKAAADTTGSGSDATPGSASHAARIVAAAPGSQDARITLATSWAAYPYATPLAQIANRKWPSIGATGGQDIDVSVQDSGGWPGSMCGGGASAPDLVYTFEPVGSAPFQPCPGSTAGNPGAVITIPAGYEAVGLARSPLYGAVNLTRREIFLALAKWIPDPGGRTVHENSNTTWRQVDAALGAEPIAFLGPPLSSAAGRSMIELLLEAGCQTVPGVAALKSTDPDRYARICRTVRTDGMYVEVSSLSPSRLLSEPNAVGIFGFRDLTYGPFRDLIVCTLDGVEPTLQGIQSGAYPGSRALYLFVNKKRTPVSVVMGLLTNEAWIATRPDSALIPLSPLDRQSALEALAR